MEVNYTFLQVPKHAANLSYINMPNKIIQNEFAGLATNGGCMTTSHNKLIEVDVQTNLTEFCIPIKIDERPQKYITIKLLLHIHRHDGPVTLSSMELTVRTGRYYDFKVKVDRTDYYPLADKTPDIINFQITIGNSLTDKTNIIDLYTENPYYDDYNCSLGRTKLDLVKLKKKGIYTVIGNATAGTNLTFCGRQSKKTFTVSLWLKYEGIDFIQTETNWEVCRIKV